MGKYDQVFLLVKKCDAVFIRENSIAKVLTFIRCSRDPDPSMLFR